MKIIVNYTPSHFQQALVEGDIFIYIIMWFAFKISFYTATGLNDFYWKIAKCSNCYQSLVLSCHVDFTCVFFSQGPFAASLDRSARRLSNHRSDVRRHRTDERPLFGKLSDQSTTDSAGVQHHPGGFTCQRCWYLKPNQLPTSRT